MEAACYGSLLLKTNTVVDFAVSLGSSVITRTSVGPNLKKNLPSEGISDVHLLGIMVECNLNIYKQAGCYTAFPVLSAIC